MTPIPTTTTDPAHGLAAETDAVLWDADGDGRIHLTGDDHLDFLQRLSTHDVLGCPVGGGLRTVFCDPRGRIVALAQLCRLDAGATQLFVGPGAAAPLLAWLERYRFDERIEWRDETAATRQVDLLGPRALALAAAVLGLQADGVPPLGRIAHDSLQAVRLDAGGHAGVRLWGRDLAAARGALAAAGAPAITPEARHILRVEWGDPGPAELTLEHNPWEAGLADAIHMNKGCYTGQEVIARLDTYRKVKQHLVGLRLAGAARPGAGVTVAGRDVGSVTSVAASPRFGWIALAYVRTDHCAAGTAVEVSADDGTVAARVEGLPFAAGGQERPGPT